MAGTEELEEASYPFHIRVLHTLCQYSFLLYGVLVLEMILLVSAIFSALLADLDKMGQTILLIDFVLLGTATLPTIALLYLCNTRT